MKSERVRIEGSGGVIIEGRIFRAGDDREGDNKLGIVLVHPYSILGGCQGLLRGMATGLANAGYLTLTFDMRGVGSSTGSKSISGFSEVNDVVSVSNWFTNHFPPVNTILLVGSSAGAPIAGSAVDRVDRIVGYVSIGYPFGFLASILFGRHHKAILQSPKPKLFIMGTRDGFTTVKQLHNKLSSASGRVHTHLIQGASHFQMEGPDFDAQMVHLILDFARSL